MIKKHFTKELAMTKKDNQGFENYTNCCICYDVNIDSNVKIRGDGIFGDGSIFTLPPVGFSLINQKQ